MGEKVAFTDQFCRSANAKNGKTTEYPDVKERGLALRVTPAGVRSWTFRYRNLAGEQKRISLGRLDDVSLKDARGAAAVERARLHAKQDPAKVRKAEREAAKAGAKLETVAEIGERYFTECVRGHHRPNAKRPKRASTIDLERRYFDRLVLPRFGKEKIVDLSRARIQAFINDVADDHSRSSARQCRVVLNALFSFAQWQEIASSNPCKYVVTPSFEARERVLTEEELRLIWQGLQSPEVRSKAEISRPVAIAILLLIVTLQRRAEVAEMVRSELDLSGKVWTVPSERAKGHRTHVVPLSDLAVDLLKEALAIAGNRGSVFPSPRCRDDEDEPIRPEAINHAFVRLCEQVGVTGVRPHDLRRSGATMMTSEALAIPRFIVGKVLGHTSDVEGARVTGTYDRHQYLTQKRAALDAWADLLLAVVSREGVQ